MRRGALARADESGWLTKVLLEQLVEAIEEKLPRRHAALRCGISPKTFEAALQDGASGTGGPLTVELARRVYQWEAKDVGKQLGHLHRMAEHSPQAAETYLKARHPADFGGFVRTTPDEFEAVARQRKTRGHLLDHPPPRMLAELKAHDWFRFPKGISAKDRKAILSLLAKYDKPSEAPQLTTGETDPSGETKD